MNSQPEATKQPIDQRPTVHAFSGAEAHIHRRIKNLVLLFSNPAVTGGVEVEFCFFDDPVLQNIAVPGRARLCQYSNRQSPPGARHIDQVHIRFKKR
jgi:hypothetical protein